MKTQIYLTAFLLLLMHNIAHSAGGLPGSPSSPEWELVDQSGQIQIYDRWLPVGTDSKARERKSIFTVNCSCEKAFYMVSDVKNTPLWMQELAMCKTIGEKEGGTIVYSLYDLPWPFRKRELFSFYHDSIYEDGYMLSIRSIDDIEFHSNSILLTGYRAEWIFKKIDENNVQITFVTFTSTPPLIPLFLQDPVLFAVYKHNLYSLIRLLEKKDENNA